MALHQASGHWRRGLFFALITASCWATLPLALKVTLEQLDPFTLTWFRFLVAALLMFVWLGVSGRLRVFVGLEPSRWRMLVLAALLLIGNYVFYLLGVQHTSPSNAQLVIQLAPLLMALGGIFIFRETYRWGQWLGLCITAIGLVLFFFDQLAGASSHASGYVLGTGFVVFAALVWAAYALLQKQLLMRLPSAAILLFIYVVASVVLLPMAQPEKLTQLDSRHAWLLAYCTLNTLVAYGAFVEALAHWEASRVSAILGTTPLLCLGVVAFAHWLMPASIVPEHVAWLGYLGAALVMLGAGMSSLLGNQRQVS